MLRALARHDSRLAQSWSREPQRAQSGRSGVVNTDVRRHVKLTRQIFDRVEKNCTGSNGKIPFSACNSSHGKVQMLADGPKSRRGSIEKKKACRSGSRLRARVTNSKSANKRDSRVRMPQVVASATVTEVGVWGVSSSGREMSRRRAPSCRRSRATLGVLVLAAASRRVRLLRLWGRHLAVASASRWDVDGGGGVIFTAQELTAATGGELGPRGDARERVHGHARGAFGPVVPRADRRTLRRRRVRG